MKSKKIHKNGYTMVEMLTSTAVLAAIVVITQQAFIFSSRSLDVASVQTETGGEVRMGMERMTQELRSAHYGDITTSTSNPRLQFKIPSSISANGTINWSGWIQYRLEGINNQQLLRQDTSSGTTTVIANKVTDAQFVKNANPATLTITMTTQEATTYGTVIPATLTGTVEPRN